MARPSVGLDHGVRPREREGLDGFEDGEGPGGDVDELDLVAAVHQPPYGSFVFGTVPDRRAAAMRDGHFSESGPLPLLTILPLVSASSCSSCSVNVTRGCDGGPGIHPAAGVSCAWVDGAWSGGLGLPRA